MQIKRAKIHITLFIILVVTIINLFYKPYWFDYLFYGKANNNKPVVFNFSTREEGFLKCKDPFCNCSSAFDKITILDDNTEYIIFNDRKLISGTYCLPKGSGCRQKSQISIYSSNLGRWSCRDYLPMWEACKTSKAIDNSQNKLFDVLNLTENINNIYEILPNKKKLRFRCQCDSLDIRGNKLISIIPFKCSQDYCVRDLKNVPTLGWNQEKKICECGPYPHENPDDETSPCVKTKPVEYFDNQLSVKIDCMTKDSLKEAHIYCPSDTNLGFVKNILFSDNPHHYLHMVIKNTTRE